MMNSYRLPKQQRGMVLVLSLILLMVMTLIGISSMNGANMELRASANARQHQVAFNGVQSLLEYSVSDAGAALVDFQTNDPTPQIVSYAMSTSGYSGLSASVVHAGCSVSLGSSIQKDKGFSFNFYNISGSGSNTTATATSIQSQGVRFPAAACN